MADQRPYRPFVYALINLLGACMWYFYTCVSLSWLLISVWICIDTCMRTEKHFSPLPQKYSVQWLPALPLRGPFAVTTKLIISPLQQAVFAALRFFSQMPTLLFVEMLPSWHRQKYICVCVDVCVWVSVCGSACLHVCCVFCGWVGVYVEWKAVRMEEWMTQTGQSGGRLVSGPYSHYQAGCSIWQLTESLQAPSLHRPTKRSALQSAPLSGCFSFSLTAAKPQSAPLIHT